MTFQCAAEYNPKMYSWSRKQVRLWLEEEGIDCGQGNQKNQMHERITQHCNHKRKAIINSTVGMQGRSTAWGVLTLFVSKMSLAQRQKEPGFTVDTAYLVPGSRLDAEGRGCCLLLTTVNHILNLARMCQWHAPSKPTAGVDHTHKVKLIYIYNITHPQHACMHHAALHVMFALSTFITNVIMSCHGARAQWCRWPRKRMPPTSPSISLAPMGGSCPWCLDPSAGRRKTQQPTRSRLP